MRTLSVCLMLLCVGLFFLGCQPADTSSPAPSIPQPVVGAEDMEEEAAVEGEEAPAEGEEAAEEAPAEGEEAAEEAPAEDAPAEGEAPAEKPAE